jgi:hypothetical protein
MDSDWVSSGQESALDCPRRVSIRRGQSFIVSYYRQLIRIRCGLFWRWGCWDYEHQVSEGNWFHQGSTGSRADSEDPESFVNHTRENHPTSN